MVHSFSISDYCKPIEHFSQSDWNAIFTELDHNQGAHINAARNPIATHIGSYWVEAIWGFELGSSAPVFHFTDGHEFELEGNLESICREYKGWFFSLWTKHLSNEVDLQPAFNDICTGLVANFKSELISAPDWGLTMDFVQKNMVGDWYNFSNHRVFAIFRKCESDGISEKNDDLLEFDEIILKQRIEVVRHYYDQFNFHRRLNDSIPWKYILEQPEISDEQVANVFMQPKLFHPYDKSNRLKDFLWPWQKSMIQGDLEKSCEPGTTRHLVLRPIETVSLVCDLRFSTYSMQLFKKEESFAQFLDDLIRMCKEVVIESGGYFDKETGDGLVAHFCQSSCEQLNSEKNRELILAALKTARLIRDKTKKLCLEAQATLNQGIDSLQMGIGIHSEDAVWFCNNDRIRAIGSSVVWASRLCSAAKPLEILVSQTVYQSFVEERNVAEIEKFKKRNVDFKEFRSESGLYAYSDLEVE